MATIFTLAWSIADRMICTTFGAGTFSWQDLVHFWKAGPGEVMTGKFNLFIGKAPNPMLPD